MIRVGVVERCPIYRYGLVTLLTTAGMHVLSATASDERPQPDIDVWVVGTDAVLMLISGAAGLPARSLSEATASINRDADIDTVVSAVREVAVMPTEPGD
jgi:hypothetical protein